MLFGVIVFTTLAMPVLVYHGEGYTAIYFKDIAVSRCYYFQNYSMDAFIAFLSGLKTDFKSRLPSDVVVACDVNIRHASGGREAAT